MWCVKKNRFPLFTYNVKKMSLYLWALLFVVFLLYGKEIMEKYDLTSFNITDPNSEDREIIIENLTKCKNIIEELESKIKKKEELESILKTLKCEEEDIKYDNEHKEDQLEALGDTIVCDELVKAIEGVTTNGKTKLQQGWKT